MQNFLKKHVVGILATILLIAIAVLAFAAFAPKGITPPVTDIDDTSKDTPMTPQEPEIPTYESVIPRKANPSENYLYEQDIRGNGNIKLCSILQTSYYSYIIAETDCKSGDLSAQKPTVGIIKTDSLGNIEKAYPVVNNCEYYYVASCVSNVGIVVITTDKLKSYLYVTVTDYELEKTETKIMSYADSVALFPTADSFLVFTDNGSENFVIKYTESELVFSTLSAGKIVDIFEFGDFYRVFYNTSSGYGMTDIAKSDFAVKKELFVATATLNCIIPMIENGKQIYIAIENEGALYVRKYLSDMTMNSSERKKIGSAAVIGHGTDGNNVYLCVKGGISGVITLKNDLSFSYSVNMTEGVASTIQDYAFGNNFSLLVTDSNGRLALINTASGNSDVTYFTATDKALLTLFPNGTSCVLFNTTEYGYTSIKIIGIK